MSRKFFREASRHDLRLAGADAREALRAKKQSISGFRERVEKTSTVGPLMHRKASVLWKGNFQEGAGTVSTESGALCDMKFSVRSRIGKGPGTSPEELFAAAVAACFSMELAREFGICGVPVEQINATATAHIKRMRVRPTVTRIEIDLVAWGQDPKSRFVKAAQTAVHYPAAHLLSATVDMTAALNSLTAAGKNGP